MIIGLEIIRINRFFCSFGKRFRGVTLSITSTSTYHGNSKWYHLPRKW